MRGSLCVARSGCWNYIAEGCRVVRRGGGLPTDSDYDLGFRTVRAAR